MTDLLKYAQNLRTANNSISKKVWNLTNILFYKSKTTQFIDNDGLNLAIKSLHNLEEKIKIHFNVSQINRINLEVSISNYNSDLEKIYFSQYQEKIILEITTLLINNIKKHFIDLYPEKFNEYLIELEKILKSNKYTYSLNMEKIIPINNQLQEESLSSLFPLVADYGQAEEFINKAWQAYIDEDYDNCVINSGKATETVMKCICQYRSYSLNSDKDTFSKLFEILNTNNFFSRDEYITPTLINTIIEGLKTGLPKHRNDSAHGSSLEPKNSNKYVAKLTLDLMVSYIHYFISLDKQL